ncbi:hypothetical protein POF50_008845 [Streptomyces sp. SL13]|uniref:Uncharacterized protein n=1 Tax=Streptantibioticus silvisoli TaxID=2705255 RepID=A0AA90JWU9_9ACTN|nr:hypothetical protein [Streptantibioticus silvisoli]MDI5969446.1 hypothetical protein [Streptantibioticus silvisoli]
MPTHPSHHDPGNGPTGTTRTRLPEGGYATPRRPPARVSRTLVTVVGIVVLLIAALAFATRGTGSGGPSSSSGTPPTGTAPHAAPTTPTGTHPVPGTTSGIPTGYPHTSQGAQSAAANYAVALGGDGMFTAGRRHEIVAATYAPAAVATTQQELDKAYTGNMLSALGLRPDGSAPSGLVFVSRTVPVGTKATAYSSDNATVQVWCTSLSGLAGTGSTKPVSESWLTITERLAWVGKDWKIASSSQAQGPAPISTDQQAAGADQIAGAVNGYGGFTYAR